MQHIVDSSPVLPTVDRRCDGDGERDGDRQRDDNVPLSELVSAVIDRLPVILAEVHEVLGEEHPDYAAFLAEELDEVIEAAEGFAGKLVGFVDAASDGTESAAGTARVEQALFEEIGRLHRQQGHDVTSLLAAYRTGSTVAWRHVAQAALKLAIPNETVVGLATTVFNAVEQLSSASLRGYVDEQSDSARDRERSRDELAELLLSDRSDSAAVRAAAARAEWTLPREASVVLIEPDNDVGRVLLARLGEACLRPRRSDMLMAIVPDPVGPGGRARLATALRGAGAVVGAAVPVDQLPASVPIAELAAHLRRTRVLDDDPLFVDEHLDALVVHRDERLLAALRRRYLRPLAELPEPARDRLSTTLTSWLLNMGNHKAMAEELCVHPQTVRYRLAQLRELFGSALDDPVIRATLLLGLAWGPTATEIRAGTTGPDPGGATGAGRAPTPGR